MAASKKYALCFVDDDSDELARFKKFLGKYYFVGVGNTISRAMRDLKKTYKGKVDLFVLDMYFPTKVNSDEERELLDQTWEKFCAAENELKTVLAKLEQTIQGGRKLAKKVTTQRGQFVFFTRKGNLNDAIEAYEDIEALSVIKKPDPPPRSGRAHSRQEMKTARDSALKKLAGHISSKIDAAIDRALPPLSDQAFIAMWFNEKLNTAYSKGIKLAIRSCGYKPMIIRTKEHANKIDDEIISEIKRSTFLIADLTGHRGGVYFEAGIAMGLGVPVIWTCRKDDIGNLHFDIRQYNCIAWTKPDDLARQLRKRILRVVGKGRFRPTKTR
jgi:hypothetical protein